MLDEGELCVYDGRLSLERPPGALRCIGFRSEATLLRCAPARARRSFGYDPPIGGHWVPERSDSTGLLTRCGTLSRLSALRAPATKLRQRSGLSL